MSKDYRHDPAKKAWREAKRRFIRKHLKSSFTRPFAMKVVCFPGEDALDVDFYEDLGVKRGNIVGIECDRKKAAAIERRKPGIQIYRGMDHEFLAATDEKFDIVDLDYECPLCEDVFSSIEHLAKRQILSPVSMLFTNVLAKRENSNTRRSMTISAMINAVASEYIDASMGIRNKKSLLGDGLLLSGDLDTVRNIMLTNRVVALLKKGVDIGSLNPVYERCHRRDHILASVRDRFPKMPQAEEYEFASVEFFKDIQRELLRLGMPDEAACLILSYYRRPYITQDLFSFYYIGSNGSPMIGDFHLLKQHRDVFEKYLSLAESIYTPNARDVMMRYVLEKAGVAGKDVTMKGLKRMVGESVASILIDARLMARAFEKFYSQGKMPERIFLGSSARREELTGDLYYQCSVVQGMSDEQIADSYKLPERGSMAAFRAHVRMGTYGTAPQEWFDSHKDNGKDRNAEIARRLAAGENEDALKTEYNLRTLAGIKAAMKRGAYVLTAEPTHHAPVEEPEQEEPLKREVLPEKYARRLSENARLRIKYFIDDDLNFMNEDSRLEVLETVRKSRWYRQTNDPSDMGIYTFFDNIMLTARSGKPVTKDYVSSLWKRNGAN